MHEEEEEETTNIGNFFSLPTSLLQRQRAFFEGPPNGASKQGGNLKYAHEGASSLEKFRVQCKKKFLCSYSVAKKHIRTHVKCVYLSFVPESNFFSGVTKKTSALLCCHVLLLSFVFGLCSGL